ncbi:polysaccharide biosynthesis C-terminal domain-containing protein [Pseudomonas sp. KCJK9016]|uniref:polysaccharide biosynthesis C-terminal domain-containing protein n=1 Tax=Pseudomonas sp. KCJK9016 TaxID=3344556 RepID=UPI003905E2FF
MIFRLLLRGGALGAKFLLVLAITRYLGYEALGFYGVVVAASLIASKFYSVGFSSEINRLISVGGSSRRVVDRVLLLYLTVGLVLSGLTVLIYSLFQQVEATAALIACVTLVLLTEHLSFEINSFVFSAQKATAGALLFFIKTGLWALLAVGGMMLGQVSEIASVLWLWVIANLLVIVAGYLIVVKVHRGREEGTLATATVWKAGLPFYLGTGLIALSQYAERFLIIDLEPYASLGKYVYAWSAANTLQALSYAVVAVVGIPVLAKRYQADQQPFTVRQLFVNKWVARSLVVSAGVAVLIYLFFNVVLDLVGAPVPRPDNGILAVLIFSFALRAIGDIVWGGLIASKNSRVSLASSAVCLLISVPVSYLLIKHYSIYGAAWGNVFGIIVQLGVIALLTRATRMKKAVVSWA